MRGYRLFLLATLALAQADVACAQAVFKCMQGSAVTYSNTPCDKLGLQSAGEVRDRITTVPAVRPPAPKAPSSEPGKAAAGRGANEVDMPKSSTLKPVNPMIDKLLK